MQGGGNPLSIKTNEIILHIQNTAEQLIMDVKAIEESSGGRAWGGSNRSNDNNNNNNNNNDNTLILKEVDALCTRMGELQKELLLDQPNILQEYQQQSHHVIYPKQEPETSSYSSSSSSSSSSSHNLNKDPTEGSPLHNIKQVYSNQQYITTGHSKRDEHQHIPGHSRSPNQGEEKEPVQTPAARTGVCSRCLNAVQEGADVCNTCGLQYSGAAAPAQSRKPELITRGSLSYILNPTDKMEDDDDERG